ncbi:MAG: DUF4838 domain-containing protein, partial [Armatimonadetes bacterium]|nr:DUF4838 domain-containing protein [Armatimonadota bacterium]
FAASELARYLGQILGKPLSVGAAAAGAPRIVLEKVADKDLGDEGYEFAAEGNTLRLRAGGDLGAVFGVYEFLRRYGGCRFSGLGPDGELVPSRKSVTAEGLPLRRKPKLWYRGPQFSSRGAATLTEEESAQLCTRWIDWMAKNGFNYVVHNPHRFPGDWFDRFIRPEMVKRGLKFDMNHHNLYLWLPRKNFAEHPEWFPLVDGKRAASGNQLGICSSNPQAVQTVIDNVLDYLRRHPEVSIIGVIPGDSYGMCHCDECTKLDVANGIDPKEQFRDTTAFKTAGANLAKTRRYTLLINQVARAVREEFPDVLVGSAAYVDLTWPDQEIPMESNVVTWVATYWRDGSRPLAEDARTDVNRMFYDALKQWRRLHKGRVITYSYYMGMNAQRSLPYPQDQVIARDWKNLKALGIEGATLQNWPDNHEVYALNILTLARCAWEDDVDPEAVLDEYLEGMYGSVAGEIRPIFDAFHAAWRRAEEEGATILPNGLSILLLMDALGEGRLDECLAAARAKAANDRERRQVAKLTQTAQYWKMGAEIFRLEQKAGAAARAGDQAAAATLKEDAARKCLDIQDYLRGLPAGWVAPRSANVWENTRKRLVPESAGK